MFFVLFVGRVFKCFFRIGSRRFIGNRYFVFLFWRGGWGFGFWVCFVGGFGVGIVMGVFGFLFRRYVVFLVG